MLAPSVIALAKVVRPVLIYLFESYIVADTSWRITELIKYRYVTENDLCLMRSPNA